MVFGIIGMVNFAHGDVFMVSAFIALVAYLILTTIIGVGSAILRADHNPRGQHGDDVQSSVG